MKEDKLKLVVGFITYDEYTDKYLPYFLSSLECQTFKDFKVFVIDNSKELKNNNNKYLHDHRLEIDFSYYFIGENLGFGKAYNKMIKKASDLNAEYFLVINPDIILEKDAIEKMVKKMDTDKKLGSVSPKIFKWDFVNNKKTNFIDSFGIKLLSGLRFIDIGQGEVDKGQHDDVKILGPSGACGLFRMSALKKIKEGENFFDESMFMYKEDCDLVFRLKLAGFSSGLTRRAIVYHDRTVKGQGESFLKLVKARRDKSVQSVKWSFLHQQLIYFKYWNLLNYKDKLVLIWHQVRNFVYAAIFERYLFVELPKLFKMRKKIKIYR